MYVSTTTLCAIVILLSVWFFLQTVLTLLQTLWICSLHSAHFVVCNIAVLFTVLSFILLYMYSTWSSMHLFFQHVLEDCFSVMMLKC